VLLSAVSAGYAQEKAGFGVGVRAGMNFSDLTSITGNPRIGFNAGLFGDYYFSRNFGVELGVFYSQQGNLDNNIARYGTTDTDYKINYLSFPLVVNYRIFNRFRIFAGPQIVIMLDSKIKPSVPGGIWREVKGHDLSGIAGVGYTFPFGLDISVSYTFGFTNIFHSYTGSQGGNSHTSMFRMNFGWRFLKY